jgi:hypothetical protein
MALFKRLSTLLKAEPEPGALALRLRRYPPFDRPHPGYGQGLSEAQALANLAHVHAVCAQRLALVGPLLQEEAGVDLPTALAAPAAQAATVATALQRWAGAAWPALQPPHAPARPLQHWLHSTGRGDDIVYSLLADIALALGELIRRGNPTWRWGVDLDPRNLADDMPSARRVVLLADAAPALPHPVVLDVEDVVVARFQRPQDPGQRLLNPFVQLLEQGLRGDALRHWRTP